MLRRGFRRLLGAFGSTVPAAPEAGVLGEGGVAVSHQTSRHPSMYKITKAFKAVNQNKIRNRFTVLAERSPYINACDAERFIYSAPRHLMLKIFESIRLQIGLSAFSKMGFYISGHTFAFRQAGDVGVEKRSKTSPTMSDHEFVLFHAELLSQYVTTRPSPTSRGLTAGSSDIVRFLDPADKPRDVGSLERPEQLRQYYKKSGSMKLDRHNRKEPNERRVTQQIFSANLMMWCKVNQSGDYNNAYKMTETKEEYQERVIRGLNQIIESLKANDQITVIALQEAPIGDLKDFVEGYIRTNFPQGWKNAVIDMTEWGVCTIRRIENLKCDPSLTKELTTKDINIRCRTFTSDSDEHLTIKITNLHLPHSSTVPAFTEYMTSVVKDIIQHGLHQKTLSHSLVGDWNIPSDQLATLLNELIEKELKNAPSGTVFPFHIDVLQKTNSGGHVRQDKPPISVDSLIEFVVKPAQEYHYTFKSERIHPIVWVGASVVTGLGASAFSEDEDTDTKKNTTVDNDDDDNQPDETFRQIGF